MAGVTKRRPSEKKLIKDALRGVLTQDPDRARLIALAMCSKAAGGDVPAANWVRDTIDGKPHQSVDMDVDMNIEGVQTSSESELTKALRDRMAGILPRRAVSSVDGSGEPGSGGNKKPH